MVGINGHEEDFKEKDSTDLGLKTTKNQNQSLLLYYNGVGGKNLAVTSNEQAT